MKHRLNPDLLSDLAKLLGRYDPDELRAGLALLADPAGVANLTDLVDKAIRAGVRNRPRRPKTSERARQSEDERLSMIRAARPDDASLVDEVLSIANARWSKARVEQLRNLTRRYDQQPITGKGAAHRRSQLISLIERAPRELLQAIAEEFRTPTREDATLEDWSDIILPNRRRRAD
ncbi:MAG TPA: hypothetical protein VGQ21_22855 [Thermoanaerobaculia bacterium]|nr:hypothetical protein [Thermoanaerobaculia bacterium]